MTMTEDLTTHTIEYEAMIRAAERARWLEACKRGNVSATVFGEAINVRPLSDTQADLAVGLERARIRKAVEGLKKKQSHYIFRSENRLIGWNSNIEAVLDLLEEPGKETGE